MLKNTQTIKDRLEFQGLQPSPWLVIRQTVTLQGTYKLPLPLAISSTTWLLLSQEKPQSWLWFEFEASPAWICLEHFVPNWCHYLETVWKFQEVESSWWKEVTRGDPALGCSKNSSGLCCAVRSLYHVRLPLGTPPCLLSGIGQDPPKMWAELSPPVTCFCPTFSHSHVGKICSLQSSKSAWGPRI